MHSLVVPVREYGYKYCPILATNSPTYVRIHIISICVFQLTIVHFLETILIFQGLAVSDHANGIAHGTSAGEVMTIFPHQLLYADRVLTKKRQVRSYTISSYNVKYFIIICYYTYLYNLSQLNSFIETVDFLEEQQHSKANESKDKNSSKDYHYMPETYNECKDRFGVIFHDNLMVSCQTCPL